MSYGRPPSGGVPSDSSDGRPPFACRSMSSQSTSSSRRRSLVSAREASLLHPGGDLRRATRIGIDPHRNRIVRLALRQDVGIAEAGCLQRGQRIGRIGGSGQVRHTHPVADAYFVLRHTAAAREPEPLELRIGRGRVSWIDEGAHAHAGSSEQASAGQVGGAGAAVAFGDSARRRMGCSSRPPAAGASIVAGVTGTTQRVQARNSTLASSRRRNRTRKGPPGGFDCGGC